MIIKIDTKSDEFQNISDIIGRLLKASYLVKGELWLSNFTIEVEDFQSIIN